MPNPFTEALKKGDIATAEQLYATGIDINVKDEDGIYPIYAAVFKKGTEMLLWVISKGIDVNQILNKDGSRLIDIMLDAGIDGMIQNEVKHISPSVLEIVKILVANGADLSLPSADGDLPLEIFNYYAGSEWGFDNLKNNFRDGIPDIDNLITYKAKNW